MNNESKIAVVDIETTGFFDNGGLIIEVGIVELNLKNGEVAEKFNSLVREPELSEKDKKGWIFENSDMNFNDVEKAPLLAEMLPEIQKILDEYPLGATAFNKKFDFEFLKDRGVKAKELPCIMLTATPIVKIPKNWGDRYKWPSVEEAWRHFFPNTPYDELHRGADDAKHEAMIAYEMYKLGKFKVEGCEYVPEEER